MVVLALVKNDGEATDHTRCVHVVIHCISGILRNTTILLLLLLQVRLVTILSVGGHGRVIVR